jgi:hypothetical protein
LNATPPVLTPSLHPKVRELVEHIFAHYEESKDGDLLKKIEDDPEAALVSVLAVIENTLADPTGGAKMMMIEAAFESTLKEAREFLDGKRKDQPGYRQQTVFPRR